jgi:CMP-N-acetylneuraminic acid synthetase
MGKGILSTGNSGLQAHELLLQFYRSFRKYQVEAEHLRRLPDRRGFDRREERDKFLVPTSGIRRRGRDERGRRQASSRIVSRAAQTRERRCRLSPTLECRAMNRTCIAVIPARGGSKRILQKNLKNMCGKPLLSYTIEAARQSAIFARIVVSTDSAEIAEAARQYGAEVPFLRAADLSDDVTPVSAATVDVLVRLDPGGDAFGYACQLMPNCPLRTATDIVDSHRQFVETGAESQLSVVRYGWQNPWWAMRRNAGLSLEPVFKEYITERSQDLPELFCPTGAIWWAKADVLRREGTYHVANRTGWEVSSWERGLDIDTEDDWALAEILLNIAQRRQPSDVP